MKKFDIIWNDNGWTVMQNADAEKHIVEISCFAEAGIVTKVVKRHNDGEEEKLVRAIDKAHSLPMPLSELKAAFEKNEIQW